jgi:anti-anti-sigma factor
VDISESYIDDVCVLHPAGRIDGNSSTEFQAKVMAAVDGAAGGVVVDFADVNYISSAGLRVLMNAMRQRKDHHLAVAALKPVINEIFEIARFQHVVKIFGSVELAVNSWEKPAQPTA